MSILDYTQLGIPAYNFAKSLVLGPSEPYISDTMQNQLIQRAKETELDKGSLGYEAFGLPVANEGGRFTGGLFNLALKDPVSFANVGSVGRVSFEKDPNAPGGYKFGDTTYNFTPDRDTGSTGNAILDFINQGGVKSAVENFFFAPAYAPEPTEKERQSIEMGIRNPELMRKFDKSPAPLGRLDRIKQGVGSVFDKIKSVSPTGIIGGLLSNLDRFDDLSFADQDFITSQGLGQDKYGYNKRSAFGNYANLVRERAKIAADRRNKGLAQRAIDEYYEKLEKERQARLQAQIQNAISQGRSMQQSYEDHFSNMGYDSPADRAADTPTGTLGRI